ncbi:MAG: flagellar type III secretion system pore protein FliP [Alphaproteobacteria bacterium]|nr:flagellar type III secretion system pore protein FliP [Alphaproteobacteria bacterium]
MTRFSKFYSLLPFGALVALIAFFLTGDAFAQSINFDMGQGPTATSRIIQTVILVTVLSLAPSILVMVTSYTRIIVVLAFLRTAMGTQTTPPNVVLISLALFLTMFVMQPTLDRAWESGVRPLMNNQIDEETAYDRTMEPIREFMLKHTRTKDIALFMDIAKANDQASAKAQAAQKTDALKKDDKAQEASEDVPVRALIPAFMISELRRAFEIGFLLFLPFLIIDMVVASILMSMGMMMLPPSIISLPFKIVFFVLVDGWYLVCGSLIQSYGNG